MTKTLDIKIADILENPSSSKAFIIADAKDADMAFGVAAPGPRRTAKTNSSETDWKTLADFSGANSRRHSSGHCRYCAPLGIDRGAPRQQVSA